MDDIRERFERGRTWLRELGRQIPGYGTYMEREARRDADQALREQLCGVLDQARANLNQVRARLSETNTLAGMGEIERVDKELARVVNRLRYAPRGYTGFFAAAQLDETALDRVYEHDAGLVEAVQETAQRARQWAAADAEEVSQHADALATAIQQLDAGIDAREQALRSVDR